MKRDIRDNANTSGGSLPKIKPYFSPTNWLALTLFICSALSGISILLFQTLTTLYFSSGALVLLIGTTVFLFTTILSWYYLKRKANRGFRQPVQMLQNQSSAFRIWFTGLNLLWVLIFFFLSWGFIRFFGPQTWVIYFNAGALACGLYGLTGILITRHPHMLALCWKSPVPDGLNNFWDDAGATIILRDRYETAAQMDQKKSTPLLWSISRIFDRSNPGGADRSINLIDKNRRQRFKIESIHRFKVLSMLFVFTVLLTSIPHLLGLFPGNWNHVPTGWPGTSLTGEGDTALMEKTPGNSSTSVENQDDPDSTTSNGSSESKMNRGEDKEESNNNRDQGQNQPEDQSGQPEGQAEEQTEGQKKGDGDHQRKGNELKDQSEGQTEGQPGKPAESLTNNQQHGNKEDAKQASSPVPSDRSDESKANHPGSSGESGDNETKGAGKPGGSQGGQGGKSSNKSQEDKTSKPGSNSPGIKDTQQGEGGGTGRGGAGKSDPGPEQYDKPQPLPKLPSRSSNMVTLDLPQWTPQGNQKKGGGQEQEKENSSFEQKGEKNRAGTGKFRAGKQEMGADTPVQHLPNWILRLIKTGKESVSTGDKK